MRGDVTEGKFEIDRVKPGRYAVGIRSTDESDEDAQVPRKYRSADPIGPDG